MRSEPPGATCGYGARVPDVTQALRGLPFLAKATEADVAALADVSFPKRLAKGQVLFTEGERSEHLYVLVSGRIKVLVSSSRGDELVISVLGPGDQLGELSVIDGSDRSASAVAIDDVEAWCVPGDALLALFARAPEVSLAVAQELAARLRQLTISTADLVFLDLPRRLAKFLVADGVDSGVTRMPQAEVAAQLGVTRQSLNRALQRLQDRGWIAVLRNGVEVREPEALRMFAES